MDRNLALEAVRVTEAAALNCARWTGRGDEKAADQAAVDAMRKAFDALAIDGTVVIGEGERDEAPMLYIGEKVGCGGPKVDIALDPLEGTTICATGAPNALAVIAMGDGGNLLNCPDTYMEKIAAGPIGKGVVDLDKTPTQNLHALAEAKGCGVEDLMVIILSAAAPRCPHSRSPQGRRADSPDRRRRRFRRHRHDQAGNWNRSPARHRRRARRSAGGCGAALRRR